MTSMYLQQELQRGLMEAQKGNFAKAETLFNRILNVQPDQVDALNLLSRVYYHTGRIDDSVSCLSRVLDIIDHRMDPVIRESSRTRQLRFEVHSNLVFFMNYLSGVPVEDIYDQHVHWAKKYCLVAESHRHSNIRQADEKLRIGYVSADFRMHSVAFFIAPILQKHNSDRYETYCYSNLSSPDSVTELIARLANHWRPIFGKSDQEVAGLIMEDGIDILVDLSGHTTNNRLLTFARKPAPVQVTYLGYPNTTGLSAIDYRITDAVTDPPENDRLYTEKLVRLPDCFICYSPPDHAPDVTAAPAEKNGYITFGSFNAITKITDEVIRAWAKILQSLPDSRLILKNPGFADHGACKRFQDSFSGYGISKERIELVGWVPDLYAHLALYGRVDLALDTFPYNGTTTTCEALWMGVPVLTFADRSHASRVGTSLLKSLGLNGCVSNDIDSYCERAAVLAEDRMQLAGWRKSLRAMMSGSQLCNANSFIKNLEGAYEAMWETYCDQKK